MKKFSSSILLLLLLLFVQGCSKKEKIIATVNNKEIKLTEFKNRYEDFLLSTGVKDTYYNRRNILNSMITEILLYYYDNNDDVFSDDEYKKEKKWAEEQIVLGYLQDLEIFKKLKVTDEELRKTFLRLNQKVAARHLYAPNSQEANKLYELLKKGADFNLLAKETFTDSILRNNGGYLGYFTWGDMDPAFEEVAFTLPIGKISKPVKTEQGYSIIKVEDRITNPIITENEYNNKKEQVKKILLIRKKRPALKNYLNSLIDLEEIQFNDKTIKKIAEQIRGEIKINIDEGKINYGNEIASNYKGKKFTAEDVLIAIKNIPYFHRAKIKDVKSIKTAIKGFYLHDKLMNIAKEKNYINAPAVEKKRKQYLMNIFMRYKMNKIAEQANIPDSLVEKFYNENKEYFSTYDKYNIREIIVAGKSLADSIYKVLKTSPNKFPYLAQKYSLRKSTAIKGGELGFVPITKLGMLKKIIPKAKDGEILGPIKISNLFGVFQRLAKKEGKIIPFYEVKEQAKQIAKFYWRKVSFKEYVQNIYSQNKINIDDNLLKNFKTEF